MHLSELLGISLISCDQGALGSLLIKLNVRIAVYRRNSILYQWPILEVVGVSAITAAISYLVNLLLNECSATLIHSRLFFSGTRCSGPCLIIRMTVAMFQGAIFRTRFKSIHGLRPFETGLPRDLQVRSGRPSAHKHPC